MEEDEDDEEEEEQAEKRSPFGLSFPSDRAAFAFFLGKSSWQRGHNKSLAIKPLRTLWRFRKDEVSEPESEWSVDTIGSTFVNEQTRSG